ncbi:MAG: hypothetical protein Q3999_05240 [Buchananella hordeovulneris]|nr:hypothetical protein [Buchananella hordeovulneris]
MHRYWQIETPGFLLVALAATALLLACLRFFGDQRFEPLRSDSKWNTPFVLFLPTFYPYFGSVGLIVVGLFVVTDTLEIALYWRSSPKQAETP